MHNNFLVIPLCWRVGERDPLDVLHVLDTAGDVSDPR